MINARQQVASDQRDSSAVTESTRDAIRSLGSLGHLFAAKRLFDRMALVRGNGDNISNNQITNTASIGTVGLDWQLGGFAADPPAGSMGNSGSISQLVRAMAGLAAAAGGGESLTAMPLDADTSQQPLLTTPQHS